VRVAVESPLGVAVLGLIASEVPDDQRLVPGGRKEHVGAVLHMVSFMISRYLDGFGVRFRTSPSTWPGW